MFFCGWKSIFRGERIKFITIPHAWLRERGFPLRGVINMAYDKAGKAVQADFLFRQQPIENKR